MATKTTSRFSRVEHFAVVGVAGAVELVGDAGGGLGVNVTDGGYRLVQFLEAADVVLGDPADSDKGDLHRVWFLACCVEWVWDCCLCGRGRVSRGGRRA